ncbi:MAG: two-component system cell cycle sensor histidine kinase/response regulator CckA [Verrucomicrobiales bacterium]|jgi:two-component system cell cycle sensor histidine kinase/response regulator CckA
MNGRILIVEDDARAGRDFQTQLARLGYSVPAVASTGQEAVSLVADLSPDLVVMNVRLAGQLDGIQTASLMQQVAATPVIFLCEPAEDLSLNRTRATYPYGYLVKPVSEDDLKFGVESALQRSAGSQGGKRSTETVLQALHGLTQGVIAADLAGNVAYLNRVAEELTGWTASDALGQPIADVFRISGHSLEPGDNRQATLRRKTGERIAIIDDTGPLESSDGSLTGMMTVFRRAEDAAPAPAAAESKIPGGEVDEQLASIARSIADPLLTFDASWQITFLNSQAAEYYEMPREEIIGRNFWQDFSPDERVRYEPELQRALDSGRPHSFDFHSAGHGIWFHVSAYPFATGLLVILRDVSRQKQLETERGRVEQLEGLSLLARGFAHDFNNLLTVLMGSLSIARDRKVDDPELKTELGTAIDASLKAQGLVQQLMTFAQGGAPIKERVRLQQLLTRIIDDRRKELSENVQIQIVLNQNEAETEVLADPKQLRRLIENLLLNAEQAIGDNGVVFVRLRREPASKESVNEMLVVEVIDSGAGMDSATMNKAFEPFFTTRRQFNATGLGLTVCESIARAHDGWVQLQSKLSKGAIASVYLPVHKAGSEAVLLQTPLSQNGHGHPDNAKNGAARILVLEDEKMIRRLITATLESAGFKVHETCEGQETIDVYREAQTGEHPFDLLIMDLSIEGGMGGVESIGRIKELDPNVRAIVSSGYCDDPAMANPAAYGFSAVLPKPYQPQELVAMVRQMTTAVS